MERRPTGAIAPAAVSQPTAPDQVADALQDYIGSVVNAVHSTLGLQSYVLLTQSEIASMLAYYDNDSVRVVSYDPAFLIDIAKRAGTPWAVVSAVAHEVAHFLAGHATGATGSLSQRELEADQFSGFVLCALGASLPQSQAVLRVLEDGDNSRRPTAAERLAAVERGWRESARVHGAR